MKMPGHRFWLLTLISLSFLLVACGTQNGNAAENEEDTAALPAVEAPESLESEGESEESLTALDERTELTGFGFSMAHPADWRVERNDPAIDIRGVGDDFGLSTIFDHRDLAFMSNLGLPEEPTIEDLLELNKTEFNWPDSIEATQAEVFGVPALTVRVEGSDGNFNLFYMGIANEEAFLLGIQAPTEEELEAFLPTWERMLDSIKPDDGT